jgi:hypothetical protein
MAVHRLRALLATHDDILFKLFMLPAGSSEAAPRLCCRVEVDGELPCQGSWEATTRRLTEATGLERMSGGRAAVRGKGESRLASGERGMW